MITLSLIIALSVPILLGYAFVRIALGSLKIPFMILMALSFGLGMGLIVQWVVILDILNIPFSLESISYPLLGISFLILIFYRRFNRFSTGDIDLFPAFNKNQIQSNSLLPTILLSAYIVYQIYFVFWMALNIPIYSWDTIYFIAMKAKVFFYEENMKLLAYLPWPFYPMQSTLSKLWVAICLGRWDDQLTKLLYPFIFLSYLIIHFYFLLRYTNLIKAFLGVVLLCSSGIFVIHGTISYNDLFMSYFLCSSIVLLFLWFDIKNDGFLFLSALFAGCGTFCKLEGLSYVGIISCVLLGMLWEKKDLTFKERFKKFCFFIIPAISIYALYAFYKIYNQIPMVGRLFFDFQIQNFSRLLKVGPVLFENLFLKGNWNIVWFLLFVSFINYRRIKSNFILRYLSVVFILFFGFLIILSLLTSNYLYLFGEQDYISLSRLILHVFPLATMMIVLLNHSPSEVKS